MSIRTPLSRVRGLGSARDGTGHFWRQRLTAVANIPLVAFLVVLVVTLTGAPHVEVAMTFAQPWVAILAILAIVSVTWHMRLGMQVVIEDYVHGELARIGLIMANTFFCAIVAFASIYAILKLSLGG